MKAEVTFSANKISRGHGRRPVVNIDIEPENELEKALLRMAYSGTRKVHIWEGGSATIQILMPRGKNE